jgi:hypothetical protein
MKLNTKLISTILIVFIISIFLIEVINFTNTKDSLGERIIQDLDSTAQALESFLENFIEEQKEKLEIAATNSELSIEGLREIVKLQEEFFELFIMDANGIIMASSDESKIGMDRSNDDYFINARGRSYIKPAYYSETAKKGIITVSTPYRGGVLAARIELKSFNDIVSDRTGLGETGESLLAYKNGDGRIVFFTKRRFEGIEIKEKEEEFLPINEALLKKETVFVGTTDYRNIPVVAATRFIEGANMGLVVKIDEAEAFKSIDELKRLIVFISFVTSILVGIVIFIISKSISKEVETLTFSVNEISKGKLNIQLEKSNIFEIQNLTDSLNRILATMKLAILRTEVKKEKVELKKVVEIKKEIKPISKKPIIKKIIKKPIIKQVLRKTIPKKIVKTIVRKPVKRVIKKPIKKSVFPSFQELKEVLGRK